MSPKGQGRDSIIFEAAIKLFKIFPLAYTVYSFNLYGLYCKLLRCIGQTPCSFEQYFV